MPVLRLFQITDTTATGKNRAVPGLYFRDRNKAKDKRRELNGDEGNGRNLRYVVSPGPDHHQYGKSTP